MDLESLRLAQIMRRFSLVNDYLVEDFDLIDGVKRFYWQVIFMLLK